jgi:pimeloyl-ACP methyl ester carboxylesterase
MQKSLRPDQRLRFALQRVTLPRTVCVTGGNSRMSQTETRRHLPPSIFLAMTEAPRSVFEFGSLPLASPWLATAPKGDGHPVLVLPGFVTTDVSTAVLRNYLDWLGYDAHAWELGRNLGPRAIGAEGEKLIARLDEVFEETGKKISLIGWSLGGMMARQLARRRPDKVRQVITLGSPIVGDPRSTTVWRMYEMMTGQRIDDAAVKAQLEESALPPPVRSTAIFSKGDGVVAWQNCLEPAAETTDNIEVYGSHCGLGVNPAVLYATADRLALDEGQWRPFDRSGIKSFLYPTPRAVH